MPKRSTSRHMRSVGSTSAGSDAANRSRKWQRTMDWMVSAGLVLLVAVAYLQVVRFEFVNYDDPTYVPDNPQVQDGFSLGGIGWAFTTFETANWYPLTWLSLMLDCQMFGPRPGGHHLMNAALHAANAVLLFIVLRRMTATRWRSAAVAALFAVHPLHVESVAWIAERKDVLSTLFFLLSLLAYARYCDSPSLGRWLLVFLSMALGLMAKSMLVTLPAVLLLLDYWPLRRWEKGGRWKAEGERPSVTLVGKAESCDLKSEIRDLKSENCDPPSAFPLLPPFLFPRSAFLEKLPLLALSLAVAFVTLVAQVNKGATAMLHGRADLPVRLASATIAYAKYLAMTVWPAGLAVYYPYDFHPSPWRTAGAAILLLAVTCGAAWFIRRAPYLAVGWLWYLGTLVPVIGLVQVGSQAMADRYCYIPTIGLFVAIVWAVGDLAKWLSWSESKRRVVLAGTGSATLAAFLVGAHYQVGCWANSARLFRHAQAVTGENPVACESLGDALLHQGKYDLAEAQFRKVLVMDPDHYRQTPAEVAQALAGQGRIGEAIAFVHEAIPETTERAKAMNNLAMFLASQLLHVSEAIKLFQEVIELAPQKPEGLKNLAWIYATCPDRRFRNGPEAVDLARRACELSGWSNAQFRQTLADAYLEAGAPDRAIEELRAIQRLNPKDQAAARQLESIIRQRR